jgi:hypothetical protein
MNQVKTLRIWDFLGMGLSLICLIHCLLIPVMMGLMPVLAASLLNDESFHVLMIAVVLPVAGLALVPGYLRTRRQGALLSGVIGLVLLSTGILAGHALGEMFETGLTVVGAAFLFRAHWINHARACACSHKH